MYAQSYIKLCVFQTFEYAKVKKMLENLKQARKILSTAHYRLPMSVSFRSHRVLESKAHI